MHKVIFAIAVAWPLSGCLFNDKNAEEFVVAASNDALPPPVSPISPGTPKTAFCDAIVGASAVSVAFTQGCLDCGITDERNVADDGARSFASLLVNDAPSTQGGAVRVTAQSGTVFAAGRNAGVFITVPQQPSGTQLQAGSSNALSVRTYLGGLLQEQASLIGSPQLNATSVSSDPELPQSYFSFTTTRMFDAVELFISNSQSTLNSDGSVTKTPAYKVYELCSDGGLR